MAGLILCAVIYIPCLMNVQNRWLDTWVQVFKLSDSKYAGVYRCLSTGLRQKWIYLSLALPNSLAIFFTVNLSFSFSHSSILASSLSL